AEAFPNLNNLPFFSFKQIDRNTYESLKSDYSDLISDLKSLGLSDKEINRNLCEAYGFCRN
ncbi:MAG: hypothetical protein KJN59_10795, partial [Bacteroidia bacterium]|nr:hypothetical protein [Bacteroidia bacterium]